MPDYKKRKSKKLPAVSKKKKEKVDTSFYDDIVMSSSTSKKPRATQNQNMRVVKGRKLDNAKKRRTVIIVALIIGIFYGVLSFILPVSVYENLYSVVKVIGQGSYPIESKSIQTLNTVVKNSYYYVLGDNNFSIISNGGKVILSTSHGYSAPVLKTSATRAILFEQGGNLASIYNLQGKLHSIKSKNNIIMANIGRNGSYVLVTESESYASTVTVYNKRNEKIYEWYSAQDKVNCVALSPNGKKIAVSTLKAVGGKYEAKVSVLDFESATPRFTLEYSDDIIYSLDTSVNHGFSVVTTNAFKFVSWDKYTVSEYKSEYNSDMLRSDGRSILTVFNRESDKTDNKIVLHSANGERASEFNFKGIISDIGVLGNHIYCISEKKVLMLDMEGNILRQAECGYLDNKLAVLGTYSVAVISNDYITKIKITEGKDKK